MSDMLGSANVMCRCKLYDLFNKTYFLNYSRISEPMKVIIQVFQLTEMWYMRIWTKVSLVYWKANDLQVNEIVDGIISAEILNRPYTSLHLKCNVYAYYYYLALILLDLCFVKYCWKYFKTWYKHVLYCHYKCMGSDSHIFIETISQYDNSLYFGESLINELFCVCYIYSTLYDYYFRYGIIVSQLFFI